jgi:microcystin degradation protein MlrC
MTELLARADAIERERPDVLCISIQSGFAAADFPEVGPTVCVTGDGARADCQAIAEAFMDHAWETRHFDSVRYLSLDEAIAEARLILAKPGRGPVVIADYADNPGAGAYGDSTFLLKAMIAHGVANAALGALIDPVGAAQLIAAGEGTEITLEIGGRIEPEYGPPLRVTGTVLKVTDGTYVASGPRWRGTTHRLGPTAVLRVGGVDVVVASNRLQCTELEVFGHAGIEPCMLDVIAVKSMQHFRAAYEPIARAVLICDSGAFASPDVRQIPYRHVRRPIYPLDLD